MDTNINIKDKEKIRKILAVGIVGIGILIFAVYSIHLILLSLSLPPYSIETEGKHVVFDLELLGLLFLLPLVVSLFLLAYLIHPSRFEKFSTTIKAFSVLFAIIGFGVSILLSAFGIINNPPQLKYLPIYIAFSLLGTSPFWLMGIFAIFSLKKDKIMSMKREYKLIAFIVPSVMLVVMILFIMWSLI